MFYCHMIEVVIAVFLQFDTGSDISFAPLNSNLRNKRHGLDVIVFYKKKKIKNLYFDILF